MSQSQSGLSMLVAVAMLSTPVLGQADRPDLKRIESATTDADPLAASTMVEPLELRVPNDFTTIYEWTDASGQRQYVRFAGGLAAVFPRSVYLPTQGGLLPDIPPGTVFQIGGLPEPVEASSSPTARNRVDGRVDMRVRPEDDERVELSRSETPLPETSIWQGDVHRRTRVSDLLRDAAEAQRVSLASESAD